VAGKTGTAQKAGVGGYQPGRHVPNFVGFAPAEKPRVVVVVVLEEPQGQYYSAEVAAPVFARILSQTLGILRIAPKGETVPATVVAEAGPGLKFAEGVVPAAFRASETPPPADPPRPEPGRMPDVRGLSAREALALFARLGVPVRLAGAGFVVSQDPPAGFPLSSGTLTLTLSESGPPAARSGRGREESSSPPVP